MYKKKIYSPNDSMKELICENYQMLLVMSRFDIYLGFGEDSIEEVCQKSNVDTYTFLAVVNTMISSNKERIQIDFAKLSIQAIVQYLHNSHSYFLEYRLPTIRQELIDALEINDDVSVVILSYFDEYTTEVNKHMMYEENILFPYINSIMSGLPSTEYSSKVYSEHHDKVEAKLSELKGIIIKYYPAKTTNEINNVLYDIFSCEKDLAFHNSIEDLLLVPAIRSFETLKPQ